ncbi:MAG TPA: DUF3572 domain-containing protein [Pseudolabrys sp.]|nr:DUF3572 domain-containing protein [Pseudolabrys sp.]
MKRPLAFSRERAEALAIQAFAFVAEESDRLERFLAATGIAPTEIRAIAEDPGFLGGVLAYIASDHRLMSSFASIAGLDPAEIDKARDVLGGGDWERDLP